MTLEQFIYPTQAELFKKLRNSYKGVVWMADRFILVRGEAPIMLVAHLDTVHTEPVRDICKSENGEILMSPQGIGGDDRCGVYALASCYESAKKKPWLLFTCDEEIGGVGAKAFVTAYEKGQLPDKLADLKLIVEIDRRGKDDAVYYDCDNMEFEDYITSKGFKTEYGSFSDISHIAPALGVAAVNLSSGYYNAHTEHEYINREHLNATIKRVDEIIEDAGQSDFPKFEYVERRLWGYGDLYDVPSDLPDEYALLYDELLSYYTLEELEAFREREGNEAIEELYEYEFGDETEAHYK